VGRDIPKEETLVDQSNDTHLKSVGYILWIFGFTGSHRFYYGKPVSGIIWFSLRLDFSSLAGLSIFF